MSVTLLGTKSVGQVCIGVAAALPVLASSLSDLLGRIANLQGQIAANLAILATPPDPVGLATAITAAAAAAASQIANIIAAIPAPIVSANVSLAADVAALLTLKASLETVVSTLTAAVSAGGVHVWSVDSTAGAVAGEVSAALSSIPGSPLPSARVQGVVLLCVDPATAAALSTVLLIA